MFLTIIFMLACPILSFAIMYYLRDLFIGKIISNFIILLNAILCVFNFFTDAPTTAYLCTGIAAITSFYAIKAANVKDKFSKKIANRIKVYFLIILSLNFTIGLQSVLLFLHMMQISPAVMTFDWLFAIFSIGSVVVLNKYEKYSNAITNIINDSKTTKGYFSIAEIFYELNKIKKLDNNTFRDIYEDFEEILVNSGKIKLSDIVSYNLDGIKYYFFINKYMKIKSLIKKVFSNEAFLPVDDVVKEIQQLLPLSQTAVSDFIINCDIEKRLYKDKEVFVNFANAENIVACGSCGKLAMSEEIVDEDGEWYCSDICKATEETCINIANKIHRSREHIKNQEIVSSSAAMAIASMNITATWTQNFRAIQTSQDYLNYTKGVGTNVKGQTVDANGNPIIATGHGDAAEIMNTTLDNISGKNAKLVGGDNAKNGADRLVNGIEVQSKYCKSARSSVDSAFNGSSGEYRYIDGNGNPMQLEVPKDQYNQAVKIMETKIKNGQVPGVSDPAKAKDIIREGKVTLAEAKNYAKFCTKESLKFDTMSGAVVAAGAFGVSFVINTSMSYFREGDLKKALKSSTIVSMKAGGISFATFVISSQLQRIPQVNLFLQTAINLKFDSALGKAFAGTVSRPANISAATAANTALRSNVALMAATMAVTSSVEVFQMMKGEISGMQCVKNIVANAGGVAGGLSGAMAGAAIGSVVPGIGNVVGGIVGGIAGGIAGGGVMKKVMGLFIEDDLEKKQRVFFFQMIYLAMIFKLSQNEANEFKSAIDNIIMDDKEFFGKKFNIKDVQAHANSILKPIIVKIVAKRPMLPNELFNKDVIEGVIAEEIEECA